jgi:malonyl-CoA/methylmalonyl-CoA synthetase
VNANLYDLFERHFPDAREQPLLIVPNAAAVSYGDLEDMSAQIAHALVAAGCKPGDRVAVQVDKHWHVLALYLASLRAGLVYLPLNTAYQKSELAYFFADAKPSVIVCNNDRLGIVAALGEDATVLTMEELVDRADGREQSFATVQREPGDLAAILYTSGTTGRSKGAMITHRNLASNATTLVDAWGFTRDDVLLHALPIFHVHGLFVATHCALLAGARMLWLPKFDAHEVLALLPRATVMMGVPTFYTRLLSEPAFTRDACASIRLFVSGSAPLLAETFEAFEARTGDTILERYGMTEAGMITSNPLEGPRVGGTVGKPLHGIEVRVVDEGGRAAPPGVIGGVQVRGPNIFAGYWRMPDKTRDEFTEDGFFKTGDVGESGGPTDPRRATCGSSDAPRTSSSAAGSTCTPRRSRNASTRWRACSNRRWSPCRIRTSAKWSPLRGSKARMHAERRRHHQAIEERNRRIQGAQARPVRGRAPAQRDGEGAEGGVAREAVEIGTYPISA